jgi:D-3-phosphoglycerate dehydrogenase
MVTNIKRLAFFEKFADPVAERILGARDDIDLVRLSYTDSESDNWRELSRAHGYQIGARTELRHPWFGDANLIAKCPSLLAISSMGAGYDVIDVDACTKAGIIVCNQSGTNKEAVAEHALGLMLALSKKIVLSDRAMRRDKNLDRFLFTGNDLVGKTVGIVGIGNIGTRTAELCRGLFRMRVLAYDPYLSKEQIAARGAEKVGLGDLIEQSDYITLHCPRTDETFGLFGFEQFSRMKPTAYFINTSRGGTYKEDDLVEALRQKKLAGAGLDVFLEEPPPTDHPLFAFDNVIVSPHNAGVTHEALANMAAATAEQWIEILSGKVPPRLINKAAWPKYSERFHALLGFKPAPLA